MKIECIKEKLRKVVGLVEKVPNRNLPLPVLGALVLEAKGSDLITNYLTGDYLCWVIGGGKKF